MHSCPLVTVIKPACGLLYCLMLWLRALEEPTGFRCYPDSGNLQRLKSTFVVRSERMSSWSSRVRSGLSKEIRWLKLVLVALTVPELRGNPRTSLVRSFREFSEARRKTVQFCCFGGTSLAYREWGIIYCGALAIEAAWLRVKKCGERGSTALLDFGLMVVVNETKATIWDHRVGEEQYLHPASCRYAASLSTPHIRWKDRYARMSHDWRRRDSATYTFFVKFVELVQPNAFL